MRERAVWIPRLLLQVPYAEVDDKLVQTDSSGTNRLREEYPIEKAHDPADDTDRGQ